MHVFASMHKTTVYVFVFASVCCWEKKQITASFCCSKRQMLRAETPLYYPTADKLNFHPENTMHGEMSDAVSSDICSLAFG